MGSNRLEDTQKCQMRLGGSDSPEGAACCFSETSAYHLQKFTANGRPTATGTRLTLHPFLRKVGNCRSLGLTSVLGKTVESPPLGIHFQIHEGKKELSTQI